MALVFRNNLEEPALCALEIARALRAHPEIQVRMGIHSGLVSEVSDVNERTNIAGAGINLAQRVMDCGDAGHILVSKRVAEDLAEYRQWSPHLRDLGRFEVKHGVQLSIWNLCGDDFGNAAVPAKLAGKGAVGGAPEASRRGPETRNFFAELQRRNVYRAAVVYTMTSWLLIQVATQVFPFFEIPNWFVRLTITLLVIGFPIAVALAWAFELTPAGLVKTSAVPIGKSPGWPLIHRIYTAVIGILAIAIAVLIYLRYRPSQPAAADDIPEKSIAVLPFANLSDNKENAFFAEGMQDDILTSLSRIGDLKVISRTSVLSYRDAKQRKSREIAQALGVAYLLEEACAGSAAISWSMCNWWMRVRTARSGPSITIARWRIRSVCRASSRPRSRIRSTPHFRPKKKRASRTSRHVTPTPTRFTCALSDSNTDPTRFCRTTRSRCSSTARRSRSIPILPSLTPASPARALLFFISTNRLRNGPARRASKRPALCVSTRNWPKGTSPSGFASTGSTIVTTPLSRNLPSPAGLAPNDTDVAGLIAAIKRRKGQFRDAIAEYEKGRQTRIRRIPTSRATSFTPTRPSRQCRRRAARPSAGGKWRPIR
jgi:hypothetical protein